MIYDDYLIFSKNKDTVDELIEQLRNTFVLAGDNASTYLGIQVEMDKKENKIKLKQPVLIERIIEALNCNQHITGKETPTIPKNILHKDIEGPERKQKWHYRSDLGMFNLLCASTRPEILFAVHQCARFCNAPKLSHESYIW